MPHRANRVVVSGAIVVVSVVGAAAIAISQIPEVRQMAEDCRRKIAMTLHNLGDEINPNRPQQPRFNRPEDAEGFMQPHAAGGEMDADDETRRKQREELMYWNAIKLENLERKKGKGPTFDDILHKSNSEVGTSATLHNSTSEEATYATKTGAQFQEEEGTLRRRGDGARGMDRGSLYANPFADENYLDADGDAKMIGVEEDYMEDIYTDNDLRDHKKSAPEHRVLAAASDYPVGQYYTRQLENTSNEIPQPQPEQIAIGDHSSSDINTRQVPYTPQQLQDYQMQLMLLERQNKRRLEMARQEQDNMVLNILGAEPVQTSDSGNASAPNLAVQDYEMQLMLLEQANKDRLMTARQENDRMAAQVSEPVQSSASESKPALKLEDYQLQFKALDLQNAKRMLDVHYPETERGEEYYRQRAAIDQKYDEMLEIIKMEEERKASEHNSNRSSPATVQGELVDVSEPSRTATPESSPETLTFPASPLPNTEAEETHPNNAFASIHAWADNNNVPSNASFYSPLPGTPRALSSAASEAESEPEHLSGDITPTDSVSLAGSGEDIGNDNASSVGGGRYDDVMSVDGEGVSTPGSWSEVGSVISEDDASHR